MDSFYSELLDGHIVAEELLPISIRSGFTSGKFIRQLLRYIAIRQYKDQLFEMSSLERKHIIDYQDGYIGSYSQNRVEEWLLDQASNEIRYCYGIDEGFDYGFLADNGYTELNTTAYPISRFLSTRDCKVKVYADKERKRVLILSTRTGSHNNTWISRLFSSFIPIFGYLFDKQPEDQDIAISKAILDFDYDAFRDIIEKEIKRMDLPSKINRQKIKNYYKEYLENRRDYLDRELQRYSNMIDDKVSEINSCYRYLETFNAELAGLPFDSAEKIGKELMEIFANRSDLVHIYKMNNNEDNFSLIYYVDTNIEYFDVDEFIGIYERQGTYINQASEKMKKVLYALFVENKATISTRAFFKMSGVDTLKACKYGEISDYPHDRLRHPHLAHYACLGGNGDYIESFMKTQDWDMAIDQSIAATKNIRFGDMAVLPRFLDDIRRDWECNECVMLPNGEKITFEEFYKRLIAEEQAKAQEQEQNEGQQSEVVDNNEGENNE